MGQQVPPPHALHGRCNTDVVGHDVDEHPETVRAGSGGGCGEALGPAATVVDTGVVGHVVAVVGTLLGFQDGGEVDPIGTEFADVVGDSRCLVKVEGVADLEAVGRDGEAHQLSFALAATAAAATA